MPKPPESVNTYRKIDQKASHREPFLFLFDSQSNQDLILLMYYAPIQNLPTYSDGKQQKPPNNAE